MSNINERYYKIKLDHHILSLKNINPEVIDSLTRIEIRQGFLIGYTVASEDEYEPAFYLFNTNILSVIVNGANQSKQLTFTIPTGYVGFLFRGESGVTKAVSTAETDFAYRSRRYDKVFKEKKDYGCMTTGNNNYLDVRTFKDPIPAKTDFDITVTNVSANNMSAWATADLLLVEEDLISDAWLTAIGQIRRVD